MGTDYSIKIYRKCDDKKIGEMDANALKNIFGYDEFSKLINCEGVNYEGRRFEYKDLENVYNAAFDKISELNAKILEKKLMICAAKNVDIKHDLEEDISYLKDDIGEYRNAVWSAAFLEGQIDALVEDIYHGKKAAYEYNGRDLPKKEVVYSDNTVYDEPQYIWNGDVYCVIHADY